MAEKSCIFHVSSAKHKDQSNADGKVRANDLGGREFNELSS